MPTKVCLDLFAGLGGFSAAFEDADGWDVVTVEIEPEFSPDIQADVMDLRPLGLLEEIGCDRADVDVLVILASPPCTLFSTAGNHDQWDLDAKEPTGDRAREHVALVYHTIGLIRGIAPDYWFLENPRHGRMTWLLGRPTGTVTYCQYGKDYMKPTGLWGDHPPGMVYRTCSKNSGCHTRNVEHDGTSAVASMDNDHAERSKVPYELSEAIRQAVDGAATEQATLPY